MTANIQLYSLATPNGQKVSIALEEMGVEYDAHLINIMQGDQFTEEFIKINPNSKIPALVDLTGDNGNPFAMMESGAILLYLAEKTGQFLPTDSVKRAKVMQWLFFQMGGVGPMFGQFGHFYKYATDKGDQSYGIERYTKETKRLLAVLDTQLSKNAFIAGDEYSIADMAIVPWVICLDKFYNGSDQLDLPTFEFVNKWVEKVSSRPGVQKGLKVLSEI
ncbi:glutathione S-transferase N-terminal domain-containing protein [Marinicellulosiphila megalodicopiae]|uniref:glutathione S-transferase N-terminal domain-containing protein n=1 Tax=Marinicellulosiphila megalodicopiae TaxID=2724896 RepID=UPI003BAFA061